MVSKTVSTLKILGTVSLGLLTGVSYSLSSLAVPSLLALPSASAATRVFRSLAQAATPHLNALSIFSSSAFALAFVLSPRPQRHPYLLYTSALTLTSVFSRQIAPLLLGSATAPAPALAPRPAPRKEARRSTPRTMEASYDVIDHAKCESETASTQSSEEADEEPSYNGEEVRGEVENYLKARLVQTSLAAVSFMMSIVGIWGDGAHYVLVDDRTA